MEKKKRARILIVTPIDFWLCLSSRPNSSSICPTINQFRKFRWVPMLVVGGDFGDFLPASFFFHLPEHPIDRNFGNTFCPYLICPICPKASKELMSKKKAAENTAAVNGIVLMLRFRFPCAYLRAADLYCLCRLRRRPAYSMRPLCSAAATM